MNPHIQQSDVVADDRPVASRLGVARDFEPGAGSTRGSGACEICGGPMQVRVLRGYSSGEPVHSNYCVRCAPERHLPLSPNSSPRTRLRLTTLMCLAGAILGVAGGLGDIVFPTATEGFGTYQRAGIVVSAVLILCAMLLRADIIVIVGMFLFGSALLADWVGMMHAPGIGWKQQTALMLASVLFAGAILARAISGRGGQRRGPVRPGG